MEAYQPLNTYSFCQTRNQQKQKATHTQRIKTFSEAKPMFVKYILSLLVVLFIVTTTVFVKIDAREPISTVPAQNELAVVVGTGDTLWTIASIQYSEVEDIGYAVYLIKERNGFTNSMIYPGQTIILPEIE